MTNILHTFPNEDSFTKRIKYNELKNLFNSTYEKKILADNYLGNY